MAQESINDFQLDGEALEEIRPLLQMARRLWARYRATNLDRIAAAIECGQVLEDLHNRVPHGKFGAVLEWLDMPETTARRWRRLSKMHLNAAEVIARGGITQVAAGVSCSPPEVVKSAITDTPVADFPKEEQGVAIENDDNALPWERAPEPPPLTAQEAMADVPTKMEEPVKKPKEIEIVKEQLAALQAVIVEQNAQIESLQRLVKQAQDQAGMPHEQVLVSTEQEAIISSQKATIHQWMGKYEDLQNAHNGLRRKARNCKCGAL